MHFSAAGSIQSSSSRLNQFEQAVLLKIFGLSREKWFDDGIPDSIVDKKDISSLHERPFIKTEVFAGKESIEHSGVIWTQNQKLCTFDRPDRSDDNKQGVVDIVAIDTNVMDLPAGKSDATARSSASFLIIIWPPLT